MYTRVSLAAMLAIASAVQGLGIPITLHSSSPSLGSTPLYDNAPAGLVTFGKGGKAQRFLLVLDTGMIQNSTTWY